MSPTTPAGNRVEVIDIGAPPARYVRSGTCPVLPVSSHPALGGGARHVPRLLSSPVRRGNDIRATGPAHRQAASAPS